jgi:hypothetical protein
MGVCLGVSIEKRETCVFGLLDIDNRGFNM